MKLTDSPLCTFCNTETEIILHLLWTCKEVQDFIKNLNEFLKQFSIEIKLNKLLFLLGPYIGSDPVNEIIILNLKHFIYKCKCLRHNLSVRHFILHLDYVFKVQKEIS